MKIEIPCICDGKHAKDTVVLRDTLDFTTGRALRNEIGVLYSVDPDAGTADVMATLTTAYLLRGIESWSLVKDGKPVPVTRATIRDALLAHYEAADIVGDAADELYNPVVMLPLLKKASESLPDTPTDDSTSPPTGPSTTHPKPSKRSSTTSSLTVVTETTSSSLDGDSSLSPNSESAA